MLKSLTSFRFIAALMVFAWHIGMLTQYQLGSVGVSFFFVLSGFILAYNYNTKFNVINKEAIKKFYVARFAKIYPVYLLTFAISIPYTMLHFHPHNLYYIRLFTISIANLLLLQSYHPEISFSYFNGVSWSISTEAFFYAVFPFLMCLFIKIKINKIKIVVFLIWLLLMLLTVICSFRDVHVDDWLLYIFPLFRVFDFAIGILIGLLFLSKSKQNTNKSITYFTILEAISLLTLFAWIVYSPHVSQGFRFSVYYIPVWCFLVYSFAFQKGLLSKVLSNKALIFLGEISFSFYMVHLLVIHYLRLTPMDGLYISMISFIISISISCLIYKFYEEPLRKKIRYGFRISETLAYAYHKLFRSIYHKKGNWQSTKFEYHHHKMKQYKG